MKTAGKGENGVPRSRIRAAAEEAVAQLLRELPGPVAGKLRDIPVVVQDRPSRAMIRDGVEPDLLGLFEGDSVAEAGGDLLPPRILLFLDNIWDEAEYDTKRFVIEVRRTLLHEIGHYLGLEEADMLPRDLD